MRDSDRGKPGPYGGFGSILHQFCASGGVANFEAKGFEFVAQTVGLFPVAGGTGGVALLD